MSRTLRAALPLWLAFALWATPAAGATHRVDDSTSIPNETAIAMTWRNDSPSRDSIGQAVEGATRVTIRLNTAPWLNRTGRIYMVLPPQPIGTVNVDWTTQGRLLAGRLVSGERTLVYAGAVKAPFIEDTLTVRVETDGRRLSAAQRLKFHFEIDVD